MVPRRCSLRATFTTNTGVIEEISQSDHHVSCQVQTMAPITGSATAPRGALLGLRSKGDHLEPDRRPGNCEA